MIPRFRPEIGFPEWRAALTPSGRGAVESFESAFANTFGSRHALSYAHGRSALMLFFDALGIKGQEVLLPAYTCSVVAHAVVLSGNHPRFVDIRLDDYNMDLDRLESAFTERTAAIIATHLFGCPMDLDRLERLAADAGKRFGKKIWLIQDCAHSFGAEWNGRSVCRSGDAALFGLNISKTLTSIFGGMLTVNDPSLEKTLRAHRDATARRCGAGKALGRLAYLAAASIAFREIPYGFIDWLQHDTGVLDPFTKAYHLDEQIALPPDHLDRMLPIEARVGLAQLAKYSGFIAARREHARAYQEGLGGIPGLILPPDRAGSTYSHFVVRVEDRGRWVQAMRRHGIELGILIQYSVPHLHSYEPWRGRDEYPHSLLCSEHCINLPIFPGLSPAKRSRIIALIQEFASP